MAPSTIATFVFSCLAAASFLGCGQAVVGAECAQGLTPCGHVCIDTSDDRENCGACGVVCEDGTRCEAGECTDPCDSGLELCGELCVDVGADPDHCGECDNECAFDELCHDGGCVFECPPPTVDCDRSCIELSIDPAHCGDCDITCDEGELCVDGACVVECPLPLVECDGVCVDLLDDADHCGDCETVCPEGRSCYLGECGLCPAGTLDCDGDCVDTWSDPDHCGGCNLPCEAGEVCSSGTCVEDCDDHEIVCANACVDPLSDIRHCGACFTPCLDGFCVGGECLPDCAPLAPCGELCVDLSSDSEHCGWCFHACTDGLGCSLGACVESCGPGLTRCLEECVDMTSSEDHCGGCDLPCRRGEICDEGVCFMPCAIDEIRCDGICVRPSTDPDHCGECAIECDFDELCALGECVFTCPDGSGLTECGRMCVDTTSDPDNCGGCGIVCTSGLCAESECLDADVGHVVVLGHNYWSSRVDQRRLLGNAVLMPVGGGPGGAVRVLAYSQYAATDPGSATTVGVNRAVDEIAGADGRAWVRTPLTDPFDLPGLIILNDVLLIYEQSLATDEELAELGLAWSVTLREFLGVGGVVVVVDGGQGNSGTWQVLEAAGLIDIAEAIPASITIANVIRAGDAISRAMPSAYLADANSVSYVTSETDIVVENEDGPMALHLALTPEE